MSTSSTDQGLPALDRARISWASLRYDFWLTDNSVPRRSRRALRDELTSNLAEASADVGVQTALRSVGPLRVLAATTARDGQLRSRWLAGWVSAIAVLSLILFAFLVASLYYGSGVLDAGVTQPVRSSLFPFIGSRVTVDPGNDGIALSLQPGPLPLVAAAVAFIIAAKPWRSLRRATLAEGASPG